jgi:hypothetical protein
LVIDPGNMPAPTHKLAKLFAAGDNIFERGGGALQIGPGRDGDEAKP